MGFLSKVFGKEQKTEKLWSQFIGAPNTGEILNEKAKALAPFVSEMVGMSTKFTFEMPKIDENKIIDDKVGDVFLEIAYFYLHYIDRVAFQYLDVDQRELFIDALLLEVKEQLFLLYKRKMEADEFSSMFNIAFNDKQYEYGQYKKLFARKNEAKSDTLFWEFGINIAKALGLDNDIFVVVYVQKEVFNSLSALQLTELFKTQ